jgi:hypothetical protein
MRLAKFLGEVKRRSNGGVEARDSFRAAFDALELINEGYLTEVQIKGSLNSAPITRRSLGWCL